MNRGRVGVLALAALSCAPAELDRDESRQHAAIYRGHPALNDPAVFFLSTGCTAALIAPRTLLTAAHCVDTVPTFATNSVDSMAGMRWRVTRAQSYTGLAGDWSPDLGLVLLEQAPPVAPLRWQSTGPLPVVGTMVRHVGYGLTETQSVGERRTVTLPILGAGSPSSFGISLLTGANGVGICNGDSGGPALVRDSLGETILGVHSYGFECGGPSGSALIYPYRRFLETWLAQNEAASCERDTRCVTGCTPVDLDCLCGADGACSSTCPDGDDPDCPASCRPDSVCAPVTQCPLDLDCLPLGTRCLRETQCASRLCLADPQNPTRYCSQACSVTAPCPATFQCDVARGACIKSQKTTLAEGAACTPTEVCADGLRCARLDSPPARCLRACTSSLECPARTRCDFAVGVCGPVAAITLDAGAEWSGPLAQLQGCSSTSGAVGLLGLGGLLGSRRRRRR